MVRIYRGESVVSVLYYFLILGRCVLILIKTHLYPLPHSLESSLTYTAKAITPYSLYFFLNR